MNSSIVKQNLTSKHVGFLVGMASVGMLFATFLISYLLYRSRIPVWPPIGMELVPALLPTLATAVLAISSFFLHIAYRSLEAAQDRGNETAFQRFWLGGTLLGCAFLALQVFTWKHMIHMGLAIRSSFFASVFYVLTGLHAFHVLIGVGLLLAVLAHSKDYSRGTRTILTPQLTGWYWHFMGGLWAILYLVLIVL
jgi:cytochrome c oxidase subunit 3